MQPLPWTSKSVRKLAAELRERGHAVHFTTVAKLLRSLGYSLQANRKSTEGKQHDDRDEQFRHINEKLAAAIAEKRPAISIDTKKKELVGSSLVGPGFRPRSRSAWRTQSGDLVSIEAGAVQSTSFVKSSTASGTTPSDSPSPQVNDLRFLTVIRDLRFSAATRRRASRNSPPARFGFPPTATATTPQPSSTAGAAAPHRGGRSAPNGVPTRT